MPGVRGGGLGPPPSPPFEAGAAAEVRKMDGPNSRFPTQPPGGSETRLKTPVCEPGGKQEADPTSHWPQRPHGCAHPTLTPAQVSGPRGPGGQWKSMRVSGRRGPKATAGSVWHRQCHRGHVRAVGRQGRQGRGGQERHRRRRGGGQGPAPRPLPDGLSGGRGTGQAREVLTVRWASARAVATGRRCRPERGRSAVLVSTRGSD